MRRARSTLRLRRHPRSDLVNAARRHIGMLADQAWILAARRWSVLQRTPARSVAPFDGSPRLALLVVNFSTTQFLKLLLLTLTEQSRLDFVRRIVVVDNGSRDGGVVFVRRLAQFVPRTTVVARRHFLSHAQRMRAAVKALDEVEGGIAPELRANVLLFCDADVFFRSRDTLGAVADIFATQDAALVGELRQFHEYPDIQASFFAVRRDVYARPDVHPLVNHGSPAYFMQRSIWRAGDLPVVDFPSNRGGWILHRGRAGVAATRRFRPEHPYATVATSSAHYMGVVDGERIWNEIEARHADLLTPEREMELIEVLARRLSPAPAVSRAADLRTVKDHVTEKNAGPTVDGAVPLRWSETALQRSSLDAVIVLGPVGEPMTLTGTGPLVWSLFEQPTSVDEAADAIVDTLGGSPDAVLADVARFVGELLAAGALEPVSGSGRHIVSRPATGNTAVS